MSRILVTGAGGQVGRALTARRLSSELKIRGLDRAALDITDPGAVTAALDGTDLVINAAAYTAVDAAETEPEQAHAVNARGPAMLAEACAAAEIPLIHLSTEYVFDGRKAGPWREDDPVGPINIYGASKAAGEDAVRAALPRHVIVRTSWVYSADGRNFVRTMLRAAREHFELRVVDDQIGAPTAAGDIADAIIVIARRLLDAEAALYGTYHYAALGETSWYGFARAIFDDAERRLGRRPHLIPVPTSAWPTAARRPLNSVLDCSRIMDAFDPPRRPWRVALAEVLANLLGAEAMEAPQ